MIYASCSNFIQNRDMNVLCDSLIDIWVGRMTPESWNEKASPITTPGSLWMFAERSKEGNKPLKNKSCWKECLFAASSYLVGPIAGVYISPEDLMDGSAVLATLSQPCYDAH